MKKIIFSILAAFFTVSANAQESSIFKGYIYNEEFQVYINMDFYKKNITVPNQEIYGELPGYFGANRDTRKWLFTSAEITDSVTTKLEITNDYGSEDLEAVLKKVIHALESKRPRARYYVTFPTYLFGYLKRLLPVRWLDRLLASAGGGGKR